MGGFQLGPLPPAPRGVPQIDVAFNIDSNGILFVTATDLGTKKKESITISNSKGRLSEQEIEKMIRDAKKFADSDRKAKARLEAKQELENLMRSIHSSLGEEIGKNLDAHEKEEMEEQLSETRKWIDSKKGKSADKEDFADRKKELERIWNPHSCMNELTNEAAQASAKRQWVAAGRPSDYEWMPNMAAEEGGGTDGGERTTKGWWRRR